MSEDKLILDGLPQLLLLLAFSVLVVTGFRRLRMPPIVGYLAVGMLLGPHALDLATDGVAPAMAELGVVFLVFTLGLEFSLPRMMAMRREAIFGGGGQVLLTTATFASRAMGVRRAPAGGRGHRRCAGDVLHGHRGPAAGRAAGAQSNPQPHRDRHPALSGSGLRPAARARNRAGRSIENAPGVIFGPIARAAIALALVLTILRWLVRPLFHEIGRSRSTDLFTLATLLVSLGAAWVNDAVGLSMALGAFLAGMLLAETEYRHQLETVIRPFRDVLLGLFFITIGTLLDLQLLFREFWLVLLLVVALQVVKTAIVMLVTLGMAGNMRKSLRAGLVVAQGGEFGFALLTLMLNDRLADTALLQTLLAATVVSMVVSPLLIRHNDRIADSVCSARAAPCRARTTASSRALTKPRSASM